MLQRQLPAVFMRGGTSKALVFNARDLPADRAEWDAIFLLPMGSPDPNGRQLDGMGGGLTSVSKVCVIGPPTRDAADIDYSFFQMMPREARVVTHRNCGNMSAAMGPFAVDEGLVRASAGKAVVRIHNTNTKKIIHASFALDGAGRVAVAGDLAIPGVAGTGAPVRLDFLDPGGAATGRLLPGGSVCYALDVPGIGRIMCRWSMRPILPCSLPPRTWACAAPNCRSPSKTTRRCWKALVPWAWRHRSDLDSRRTPKVHAASCPSLPSSARPSTRQRCPAS